MSEAATEIPNRELKVPPEAEQKYRQWIAYLNDEFSRKESHDLRSEIVRDALFQIYLGKPHGGRMGAALTTELPLYVLADNFDPRNVTLDGECLGDVNTDLYYPRKPLIWFWQMFDRSPLGLNHWLGVKFRCMLGRHIFKQMGKNVKISRNVEFTFGYNLVIEDNVVIQRNVLLDDRHDLTVRDGSFIKAGSTVS